MKWYKKYISLLDKSSPEFKRRFFVIIGSILVVNIGLWIIAVATNIIYPFLLGLIILAYGLGLRHAVDADHIAAIDNTTRKLMSEGKKPLTVGLFFSLGHSTIVILLTGIIAFSTSFLQTKLPSIQALGSLIGSLISSFFLLLIGIINLFVLIDLLKTWSNTSKEHKEIHHHVHSHGIFVRIFKPLLKTVTKSYHMYFVGFLFGLGFDTASEIALLSISATTSARGLGGYIFLLPLAFTAGMVLIDTLDGMLMLAAYGWAYLKPLRKLYYNIVITLISVIVALIIGGTEALQLLSDRLNIHNDFFDLIGKVNLSSAGFIIIAVFIICWFISLVIYRHKRYDRKENYHE